MTQGVPLSIVAYGIVVLPLIKRLKAAYAGVTEPWYADGTGALGKFYNIGLYFNSLKRFGLGHGYYPKPLKRFLILHPDNLASGKGFGLRHGFKVFTGAHYLGSFIGDDESKLDWLKYRTSKWERNIRSITKTAEKYPHESYATVVCAIQLEWIFLKCVTKDTGCAFAVVEKIPQEIFLPRLFF